MKKFALAMASAGAFGAITLGLALFHQSPQRQDALARQLDDPALRTLVPGPGLHVPVACVVERGVARMQVEAGLPAIEQRDQLAWLFAGQ